MRVPGAARLLVIFVLSGANYSGGQAVINVGANVQVTNSEDDHVEVLAAADPNHRERLIACYMVSSVGSGPYWTAASVSLDGGSSWSQTAEERTSRLPGELLSLEPRSLDPTCAYGPDGSAYFAAVLGKSQEANSFFFRSPDGGKTWSAPIAIWGAWDRPYISVDITGGKYSGRIYINHTYEVQDFDSSPRFSGRSSVARGIAMQRSVDGGRTFLGLAGRIGMPGEHHDFTSPGNSVILSDGTVVSLFFEFGLVASKSLYRDADGDLKVVFSRDGGESYVDTTKVAEHFEDRSYNIGMQTMPSMAVDPGSPLYKDRLYVAWHESKNHQEAGRLSYSADKGKTWSTLVPFGGIRTATDGRSGANEFQVTVAANKNGVVGVMWYESQGGAERADYWVRFAASLDGGETWLPSVRVSEAPNTIGGAEQWLFKAGSSHPSQGEPVSVFIRRSIWQSGGHTAGLTADAAGVFHAFWVDNRTGIRQVWTAPIIVSGSVIKNGAKELADLKDVSDEVDVEVGRITLDHATNRLSAALRLKNISQATIIGPLKLRIMSLHSSICASQVLRADPKPLGSGAIIDLTDHLHGGMLAPGDLSSEYEVDFKLGDCDDSFQSDKKWIDPIVEFKTRVFAKP